MAGLVKCPPFLGGLNWTVFSLRKLFLEGGGGAGQSQPKFGVRPLNDVTWGSQAGRGAQADARGLRCSCRRRETRGPVAVLPRQRHPQPCPSLPGVLLSAPGPAPSSPTEPPVRKGVGAGRLGPAVRKLSPVLGDPHTVPLSATSPGGAFLGGAGGSQEEGS